MSAQIHTSLQSNIPPIFGMEIPSQNSRLTHQQIWELLTKKVEEYSSKEDCDRWLSPLKVAAINSKLILVLVPNTLIYQRLHDQFLDLFERAKVALGIGDVFFQFELESSYESDNSDHELSKEDLAEFQSGGYNESNAESEPLNPSPNSQGFQQSAGGGFSRSLSKGSNLNPHYVFETFVKGASNQFAMTTCQAVAQKPGQSYNPLFIFGSTGLGKTHLLQAVGNLVLRNNPNALVTYITSERFMNEMVYCLRHKKCGSLDKNIGTAMFFLLMIFSLFQTRKRRSHKKSFFTLSTRSMPLKSKLLSPPIYFPKTCQKLRKGFAIVSNGVS